MKKLKKKIKNMQINWIQFWCVIAMFSIIICAVGYEKEESLSETQIIGVYE